MPSLSSYHIPIELMEILNKINDNINEVKVRIASLEALDHSESIKSLRAEIEKERAERINLQIEVSHVKTKLAPIVGIVSVIGSILAGTVIQFLIKTL